MAKGRPNKATGYCDYKFADGTYCDVYIERIIVQKNGKSLKQNKWKDYKKRNFCIFHSHNNKKEEVFYDKVKTIIDEKNKDVIRSIRALDGRQLSEKERESQEDKIREEHFIDFEGFYFPKIARFVSTIFESLISFLHAEFDREAFFLTSKFKGGAIFRGTNFCGEADFSFARFDLYANFLKVKFSGEAIFHNVIFIKEAAFDVTKFEGVADFESVEFGEQASFTDSIFREEAHYLLAEFQDSAYFNRSLFHLGADFSYTTHVKVLDCMEVAFLNGKLDFTRASFPFEKALFRNTIFNCEVLFHEQMLKGVRFTGCYLGSASFYGSDVRDAVFINSSWNRRFLEKQIERLKKDKRIEESISVFDAGKKPPRTKHRAVLFDEKSYKSSITKNITKQVKKSGSLNPELDPLYLEHLYCQFKLAMDRNKMYGLANDFYYGEKLMETKRLWEEGSLLKWSFLKLYKLLSGFGNSPWRAIISLILILFASSFLLIRSNGLTAVNLKEANERCPCESYKAKSASAIKQNFKTPVALTKTSKSDKSHLLNNNFAVSNAPSQSTSSSQPVKAPVKVAETKEPKYSLKSNYLCNVFHVSLWNLTASPGRRSGDYKENSIPAYLAVFFIQYVFRPLMVALIIISVRRKVYRG